MSVCVCVVIPVPFILDVRLVDAPAGVTPRKVTQDSLSPPAFCGTGLNFYREKDSAFLSLVEVLLDFKGKFEHEEKTSKHPNIQPMKGM